VKFNRRSTWKCLFFNWIHKFPCDGGDKFCSPPYHVGVQNKGELGT